MAYFRQIDTSTWKDPWFFDLEPDEKLLFIYLFSNENTSISGIYEIPFRVICFETGLESEFVEATLDKFEKAGKAYFENGVVWVTNMRKHHETSSPKLQKGIENDLAKVPSCPIKQRYIQYYKKKIGYGYPMDTDSHTDSDPDPDTDSEPNGTNVPTNLDGWLQQVKNGKNKQAALMRMFETLYPRATEKPDFAYIGRVAKNVGGAGRLAALFWECSGKQITGDVMQYVQGYSKNHKGKPTPKDREAELKRMGYGKQ